MYICATIRMHGYVHVCVCVGVCCLYQDYNNPKRSSKTLKWKFYLVLMVKLCMYICAILVKETMTRLKTVNKGKVIKTPSMKMYLLFKFQSLCATREIYEYV